MAKSGDYRDALSKLEDTLELYLVQKAPEIPHKWKDIIVQFMPWLTLIGLVMIVSVLMPLIGLNAFFMPFSLMGGVNNGISYMVGNALLIAMVILEALAVPGLFKKEESAWRKIYWASLLGLISNILTGSVMNAFVSTLVLLYILFQVKEKYR